jgi:arylsulfatase A-like enzyme
MPGQQKLSRRDFLKLLALLPGAVAARSLIQLLGNRRVTDAPNVFIFVFDAWSANHLSMFGYPRATMPNLERFAERTFVFHNHYSTASFTVPGTASLLTGLYPWSHRAMHLGAGGVARSHQDHNIFAALEGELATLGYAQNPFADLFLYQFDNALKTHLPNGQFSLEKHQLYNLPVIENDAAAVFAAFDNNILTGGRGLESSLFIEPLYRLGIIRRQAALRKNYKWLYPKGLPESNEFFLMDQTIDGGIETLRGLDLPTLAYFHLFPPHGPYSPTKEYMKMFADGWVPPEKPIHPLSQMKSLPEAQLVSRLNYDQYLAAWDAEVARLLDFLETSGMLDNSIVIFTSDHGELFERGDIGHNTLLLSDAIVHIPLLISVPGQTGRKDIHAFTSSVDLLPTIAHQLGNEIPAWVEGSLLPELGGVEDPARSIFSFDAKLQSAFAPLTRFSASIMREGYKLINYQYPDLASYEFYSLTDDPEELIDLYSKSPSLALQMKDELREKIDSINRSAP